MCVMWFGYIFKAFLLSFFSSVKLWTVWSVCTQGGHISSHSWMHAHIFAAPYFPTLWVWGSLWLALVYRMWQKGHCKHSEASVLTLLECCSELTMSRGLAQACGREPSAPPARPTNCLRCARTILDHSRAAGWVQQHEWPWPAQPKLLNHRSTSKSTALT